ncbi:hypothetical protein TH53_04305 [Pedobacter lusitanus]|uniref:Uncharacterized protein n=1 Tax=Pedobacter lusitanus TaxID=1503925 RepID=A0A0D0GV05_9SPHI|nr:hypothetical protein [Pedobacter lusitanus]KIO78246.1 hypothetical protein TH53_04305 [Pedobacter lusitanus]
MKKALSILLILLYTTASFGLSVKQFYCCGQLSSVSLDLEQSINEQHSESSEKGRCCENQFRNIKGSHILSAQSASPAKCLKSQFLLNFITLYQGLIPVTAEYLTAVHPGNAPPITGNIPVYILNCTYRI